MPTDVSAALSRGAPLLVIVLVVLGFGANLRAGPGVEQPALALPTALSYLLLAGLFWPGPRPPASLRNTLAGGIALGCAMVLADRFAGLFGGHADAALKAAELSFLPGRLRRQAPTRAGRWWRSYPHARLPRHPCAVARRQACRTDRQGYAPKLAPLYASFNGPPVEAVPTARQGDRAPSPVAGPGRGTALRR